MADVTEISREPEIFREKVRASLLAGALGDSMGADIESLGSYFSIWWRFPRRVNRLARKRAPKGWFTDDTQMTLFTAEGLIDGLRSDDGTNLDVEELVKSVHAALLRWYQTQTKKRPPEEATGLAAIPEMYYRAFPGNTCQAALKADLPLGEPASNNRKGCGTIMRVAPLAFSVPHTHLRDVAIKTSALTHGHPVAQLAASAWAELLAGVAKGEGVEDCARNIAVAYSDLNYGGRDLSSEGQVVASVIDAALAAKKDRKPSTVSKLGEGWVADEALAIALYSVVATNNFDDGLQCALRHAGDSDSTAAIAGNLLGLLYPDEVYAHPLLPKLGGRTIIEDISTRLTDRSS